MSANVVEGHCLQAMKIVHYHAKGCFDWLIFEKKSLDPWKEANFILFGKYKHVRLSILCSTLNKLVAKITVGISANIFIGILQIF